MILTCPSCATRYLVDPAALGETGRMVRCGRCAHTWVESPPEDMPKRVDVEPPPDAQRPIPPGSNLPALREPQRRTDWVGWLALAVVLVAVIVGAVSARERVVAAWPAAAHLYAAVGLETGPAGRGLKLNVPQDRSVYEGADRSVVVEGEVVNVSDEARRVPNLVASAIDANQRVLKSWVVPPPTARLAPGEAAPFSHRFADAPTGIARLEMDFEGVR